MTTITATPQPATASVALTITPTATVTQVLRTDANGIAPVRTQAGVLPTAGSFAVVDYEAALTGTVNYTVVSTAGASTSTALELTGDAWLTVPTAPAYSQRLDLVTGATLGRTALSAVHHVIDRPDPVVTIGPLGLRAGTLELWCPTYEAARALEAVYASGEIVQLRQDVPGMDMYHVATDTSAAPASELTTPRRWLLAVTFVEVAYPIGNQIGTLGWSIDDVTAAHPTVAALALAYPTVNALTIGPL